MTTKTNTNSEQARNRFDLRGQRDLNITSTEIAGVMGGLMGAVVAYADGASPACVLATAVVGGTAGYAMGNMLSPVAGLTGGTKIIGGAVALSFGLSCASITTVVGNAFGKLGQE